MTIEELKQYLETDKALTTEYMKSAKTPREALIEQVKLEQVERLLKLLKRVK